jgi:hypothetical protein
MDFLDPSKTALRGVISRLPCAETVFSGMNKNPDRNVMKKTKDNVPVMVGIFLNRNEVGIVVY